MTIRKSVPREMPHLLSFDGVTGTRVTLPPSDIFVTQDEVTVAGRFFYSAGGVLLSCNTTDSRFEIGIQGDIVRTKYSENGSNVTELFKSSTLLVKNKWYDFVYRIKKSTLQASLQLDMVEQTGTTGHTNSSGTDNVFYLGARQNGGHVITGILGELKIWNRYLSNQETSNLHYYNIVPQEGLFAHYTRISDDGTQLLDIVGGNHGTITGATRVTDLFGIPKPRQSIVPYVGSLSFDGVDDFVRVLKDTAIDCGQTFTFRSVFNPISSTSRASLLQNARAFGLHINGGNVLAITGDGLTQLSIPNRQFITDDIIVTYDGTTLKMYRYGVLVASTALASVSYDLARGTTIGKRDANQGGYWYQGSIQQTRIYNLALTTKEVEDLHLYNVTPYDNDPSICKLNLETTAGQIVGDTWFDKSGNNNHGTITGAVLV